MRIVDKNLALTVGGILFAVTGLLHLLRLFTHSEMVLSGHPIPVWGSALFLAIAWFMAGWFFLVRRCENS
jgi:hypothetical protein